jgi:membrane protein
MKKFMNRFRVALALWWNSDPTTAGAAIAYYALFSLPPMLFIIIATASSFISPHLVEGRLVADLEAIAGRQGTQVIQSLVAESQQLHAGVIASGVSIVTILFAAVGLFSQLQTSLDRLWSAPVEESYIGTYVQNKLIAFAMILILNFLMVLSFTTSTVISLLHRFLILLPLAVYWIDFLDTLFAFILISALFISIYIFLPRTHISRRAVLLGGLLTALLFMLGRWVITLYLSSPFVLTTYGAASTLIILLVWVYYSAQVFLFGAAVTYVIDKGWKTRSIKQ